MPCCEHSLARQEVSRRRSSHILVIFLSNTRDTIIHRSLRAYTARQLSGHAARVMNSQGVPPAAGRDKQDVFLDLMSQVDIVHTIDIATLLACLGRTTQLAAHD